MKKNTNLKKKRRRLLVFGTISFLVLGWTLYNICYYTISIIKLSNQHTELKVEKNNLLESSQDLKAEITKLKDPEYIARYARENYYYSKDGEYILKMPEEKQEKNTNKNDGLQEIISYIVGGSILTEFLAFVITRKK